MYDILLKTNYLWDADAGMRHRVMLIEIFLPFQRKATPPERQNGYYSVKKRFFQLLQWFVLIVQYESQYFRKLEDVGDLPQQKTAEIYYQQQYIKITKC